MNEDIQLIRFDNRQVPSSHFDIVKIEDLFRMTVDHDITRIHRIDFYIIFIATEGQGYHTIDFTDYAYRQEAVLTIRKGQLHKFSPNPSVRGYMLLFTEGFIASHLEKLAAQQSLQLFNEYLTPPRIELESKVFLDLIHLVEYMEMEYANVRDDYSNGIIRSLLHILLTKLHRHKSSDNAKQALDPFLLDFLAFQQLVEAKCLTHRKVQDYAAEMGLTSAKLNKIVKRVVRKTAKTFIDEIAILQIKRLLINTELNIKEIAYQSGFDDPTNLFKFFKRFVSSSPEAFRQAHK